LLFPSFFDIIPRHLSYIQTFDKIYISSIQLNKTFRGSWKALSFSKAQGTKVPSRGREIFQQKNICDQRFRWATTKIKHSVVVVRWSENWDGTQFARLWTFCNQNVKVYSSCKEVACKAIAHTKIQLWNIVQYN